MSRPGRTIGIALALFAVIFVFAMGIFRSETLRSQLNIFPSQFWSISPTGNSEVTESPLNDQSDDGFWMWLWTVGTPAENRFGVAGVQASASNSSRKQCNPDFELCNDNDPCTEDYCTHNGFCASIPRICGCNLDYGIECPDDGNPCTTAECVPKPGFTVPWECKITISDDCSTCNYDSLCDDFNPCTTDFCVNGACTFQEQEFCEPPPVPCGSLGIDCNDHNDCTYDWCGPRIGGIGVTCNHRPLEDGNSKCKICEFDSDCTDWNLCTIDTCFHNICEHTSKICEDDGLTCTEEYCYPGSGQCLTKPNTCNDNDPCTGDACDNHTDTCYHWDVCEDDDGDSSPVSG